MTLKVPRIRISRSRIRFQPLDKTVCVTFADSFAFELLCKSSGNVTLGPRRAQPVSAGWV